MGCCTELSDLQFAKDRALTFTCGGPVQGGNYIKKVLQRGVVDMHDIIRKILRANISVLA